MTDFVLFQLSLLASLFTIQYSTGLWVRNSGIKVNYTRKINHFALFFVPVFFALHGLAGFVWIPLLIIAFGDGLAEPVGIRFGRHKYKVYALFSKKKYVRSLEGSACVFLASIIVIIVFHHSFTQFQFIIALTFIPFLMTLVEAFSPHTWDTPTLFLAGYGALYGITRVT